MAKLTTSTARRPRATTAEAPRRRPSRSTVDPGVTPQDASTGARVRMYRVGFGDFFLLSVPSPDGSKHILVDCGVHAKDLNTIGNSVAQMEKDCGGKLALIIMTHRHADHISGFARCADVFKRILVESVWMPWFENQSQFEGDEISGEPDGDGRTIAIGAGCAPRPAVGAAARHGRKHHGRRWINQKALDVLQSEFREFSDASILQGR